MSESTAAPTDALPETQEKRDFIRQIVREDLAAGRHDFIRTRFPPEPNGYLHIGHAKSICLNFGVAGEFGGVCNLRFDDTNPAKEDPEYVAAIQDDVRWLGFEWNELRHASDYFDAYYLAAEKLIADGKAYVCDLSAEEVRAYRGTLTEPGRPSPWRDRSVEENLDLFRRMRAGEFPDGARTVRAKIDMASGNINLRDPALYRIKHVEHQNTGNAWPIYPMYDFAHALGDSIEGITHSLCTLEFEDHRPLYDWCVDNVDFAHDDALTQPLVDAGLPREAAKPRQIEFSRLNINYTVMSKRKLMALVTEQLVDGWEDPRMPTLQGLRRRGYTPAAMRLFAERVGISKQNSLIDFSVLEGALREDLDSAAPRRMAVVDPVKLVLTNLADGHEEQLTFSNHPKDESFGTREVPFAREVWIDREDFAEVPPKGWKRLVPGGEVRLRGAGTVVPVRAHRLLRCRPPRPHRSQAGVQPQRDPARHLVGLSTCAGAAQAPASSRRVRHPVKPQRRPADAARPCCARGTHCRCAADTAIIVRSFLPIRPCHVRCPECTSAAAATGPAGP